MGTPNPIRFDPHPIYWVQPSSWHLPKISSIFVVRRFHSLSPPQTVYSYKSCTNKPFGIDVDGFCEVLWDELGSVIALQEAGVGEDVIPIVFYKLREGSTTVLITHENCERKESKLWPSKTNF